MWCFILVCALLKFLQVIAYSQCGGIFTNSYSLIQSPGYPNSYPRNLNCKYILKGEGCPTYYNLQFLDFDVEKSSVCTKDYLKVDQHGALCGKHYGVKNYFSQNGDLMLNFVTDRYSWGKGFKIAVTRQACLKIGAEDYSMLSRNCCSDVYDQKQFVITNPGFPYSRLTPFECEYKIRRANDRVRTLKLNFVYYWNGVQDKEGCSNGYLEIDNKEVCGCRSGLKMISTFNETFKTIKYRNNGFSNGVNGFVIEVSQEETPENIGVNYCWEFISSYLNNFRGQSYVHTSVYYPNLLNVHNNDYCRVLNTTLRNNVSKCTQNEYKCTIFDSVGGTFQSNGYPLRYGRNLNECYRFTQQQGYCSIKFYVEDFDLQYSNGCTEDYVLVGNNSRYCGNTLWKKIEILTFYQRYVDFIFVTNNWNCGRGFKVQYEQQLCNTVTTQRSTVPTRRTTRVTSEMPMTTPEGSTEEVTEIPTRRTTMVTSEMPMTTPEGSTEKVTEIAITTPEYPEGITKVISEIPTSERNTEVTEIITEANTEASVVATIKMCPCVE